MCPPSGDSAISGSDDEVDDVKVNDDVFVTI